MNDCAQSYMCPKCHRESHNPNDVAQMYCGHCHVFAKDLRDEVVTEFADICPTRLTRRDCFSLAALTLLRAGNEEARLVHAFLRSSFDGEGIVEHAWCEFPATGTYSDGSTGEITVVIDYSQLDEHARIIPRDEFYRHLEIKENTIRRFTKPEAMRLAIIHGRDGPWPRGES